MIDCRILIQARMTSSRFPGKMLAPLAGRPIIGHVVARAGDVLGSERVVVVTSGEPSDDPLADYVEKRLNVAVYRGDLANVVQRFQNCLREHPCTWFVRICGDSPVIDPALVTLMLERTTPTADLVSNVAKRTFPPGQSVEIIRTSTFLEFDAGKLPADEQEHVTAHFYRHPQRYDIVEVSSNEPALAERRLVVDTLDDHRNIEVMLLNRPELTRGYADYAAAGRQDD